MSIKQPKPLQIRLPFSVPKPNKSTNTESKICGICRKRESRYTCPRCNILYCSLDCFRDESHAQCSEPFYRSTILSSIATDPKVGMDEKKNMMDMLRRFEDAQADGEDPEEILKQLQELEKEEEEHDELLEKLQGIDLNTIDSNELFHLLPQDHRDAFLAALKNPESEEAKELLEQATRSEQQNPEERPVPNALPWWEDDLSGDSDDNDDAEAEGEEQGLRRPDVAPMPREIPQEVLSAISPPEGVGNKLVYNAIAICIAYLHTLLSFRLPSLSLDYLHEADILPQEIKEFIGKSLPFLIDQKSTVRYENIPSAWGSVWDKITLEKSSARSETDIKALHHLLSILPSLLHPPITTPSYPKLFYVLSDLYGLYSTPKSGGAIPRKLAFYTKALSALSRSDWLVLERLAQNELSKLVDEQEDGLDFDGMDKETDNRRENLLL
ncbi:uncharacterized protein I303_106472 [Kwoniella dejecticola CBS 10117]|uniref:HIT-type domain-containing protein n=1 Tax=Kwoniella dejecticola CBS 10117 TaxID=1296121 RepID=A0A1A5ZUL5_9TREE|nr:uncharacterized protein I303_08270 [Kwoniella dejecticola CBS 10117]OBR81500.1 hypothetical protein I303_08270 [Kwoniella dejecticola CBS 10117]